MRDYLGILPPPPRSADAGGNTDPSFKDSWHALLEWYADTVKESQAKAMAKQMKQDYTKKLGSERQVVLATRKKSKHER